MAHLSGHLRATFLSGWPLTHNESKPMQITFTADGDDACTLVQKTMSSSTAFSIPISKPALQSGLRELLLNPEKREVMVDSVMIDRSRDGLRVHAGGGRFELPYRHLLGLILGAAA